MSLLGNKRLPRACATLLLASALPAFAGPCNTFTLPGYDVSYALHKVKYQKKRATPGDIVNISGTKYRIVRVPFVEFKSGQEYALIYPAEIQTAGGGEQFQVTFTTTHVQSKACNDIHIPGKANTVKNLGVYETRTFSIFSVNFGPGVSDGRINVMRQMVVPLSAQIRQTHIGVYLVGRMEMEIDRPLPPGDYDLEGDINTSKMSHKPNPMLSHADRLVDYVYIEKL